MGIFGFSGTVSQQENPVAWLDPNRDSMKADNSRSFARRLRKGNPHSSFDFYLISPLVSAKNGETFNFVQISKSTFNRLVPAFPGKRTSSSDA